MSQSLKTDAMKADLEVVKADLTFLRY